MQSSRITIGKSFWHFHQWGKGKTLVIAMHGFGETCGNFDFLEPLLGDQVTWISLDLPYHGHTLWRGGKESPIPSLKTFIETCCKIHGTHKVVLVGYSMGGRYCLKFAEEHPGLIEKLILLAPDGVHRSPWFDMASKTTVGKTIFWRIMHHPGTFFRMLDLGHKAGLVSPSMYKFVSIHMKKPGRRRLVFATWQMLARIEPDLKQVKANLNHCGIPLTIILGRFDKVIPPIVGHMLAKDVKYAEVIIRDKGHVLLEPSIAPIFQAELGDIS
jgi:pimeloyl-ACP methyl ester carboxylesterase